MTDTIKPIPAKELRNIQYNILLELDNLCKQLNIRYSLCGGSLLGAVRHKAFIPWDDDIDIIMPRPDYDALIAYCRENETSFRLISHENEREYGYLFAKATAKNTVITDENCGSDKLSYGVYVDIFPVDALGDTVEEAHRLFKKTDILRNILIAKNWKRFFRSKTRSIVYEPVRLAFFILSRFFSKKSLISRIEKQYSKPFGSTEYCACVCGSYRSKEILPTSVYEEYTQLEFEGRSFMALKNYDAYLTAIYGDYMTLPPKEKQVSHHSFTAYYKEENND